ncbi:tetratricopeptide repeat-containing glycosyltransferase family 2 protein [Paenibacillus rigui]|nr:glycosyltransferase family 2 protein [Paenibacillus rigui]
MQPLLSLCMIVKDEEKVLRRCLNSVAGLADEIIIVDTGSTDTTKQIAYQYTDKVFDYQWTNDFAAARNEAVRRATGRWILTLDADEYVQNHNVIELRAHLENTPGTEPIGFVVPILNFSGYSEHQTTGILQSTALRIFSNGHQLYYAGAIHEQVINPQGSIKHVSLSSCIIFHTGYTEQTHKEKNKTKRNLDILDKVKNQGGLKTPYDFFTLANEYFTAGELKKSLYYYEKAQRGAKPTEAFFPHCIERLTRVNLTLERFKEAELLIEDGLKRWGSFADFHFLKGLLYEVCGFSGNAIAQYEETIRMAEKKEAQDEPYWLLNLEYGKMLPYERLTDLYYKQRDLQKTVFALTKLLNMNPQHYQSLIKLALLLTKNESETAVISFFEKMFPSHEKSNHLLLFKTFLLLGEPGISKYYYEKVVTHGGKANQSDVLRYAILTRDRNLFEAELLSISNESSVEDISKLKFVASVLWDDQEFIGTLSGSENEAVNYLYELGTALHLPNTELPQTKDEGFLYALLIDLFVLRADSTYDRLINEMATPSLINKLSHYFYRQNMLEMAFQYYSLLMENGELGMDGYLNLIWYQLFEGDREDAFLLMQQAFQLKSSSLALFGTWFEHSQNAELNKQYKQLFQDRFPAHKSLSFI